PTSTGFSSPTTSNRTAATPSAVTCVSAFASSPRVGRPATAPAGTGPAGAGALVCATVRSSPSVAATARSLSVTARVLPAASDGSRQPTDRVSGLNVPPSLACTYSNPSGRTLVRWTGSVAAVPGLVISIM